MAGSVEVLLHGGMVMVFGQPWDSPACDGATVVATPVGELCTGLCGETISDGDRGFIRPHIGGDTGRPEEDVEFKPIHAECDLRNVLGHQFGICGCAADGGAGRDNARRVLALVNEQREAQGAGPLW